MKYQSGREAGRHSEGEKIDSNVKVNEGVGY